MVDLVKQQQSAHDELYALDKKPSYFFNFTTDPLVRYLRDRRLTKALNVLQQHHKDMLNWKILIVCGGVGGEGYFFVRNHFKFVTVTDISENSLKICNSYEPSIETIQQNGEALTFDDNSYDLVVVQDGLHHLSRPVSGFTEMLRVARKGIIVIEPFNGLVARLIGTEWEVNGEAVNDDGGPIINHVFRWDKTMITQTVKSLLLKKYSLIKVIRCWDHGLVATKVVSKFSKSSQLQAAKLFYALLRPFSFLGNQMVAVIIK